jgi:hypothetical protein
MTGFNHGCAGGLIGNFLPAPLALPLAFLSHFALDMVPHFGIPHHTRDNSKMWKYFTALDFVLTIGLAALAIYQQRYLVLASGTVAIAPDFIWVGRVVKSRSYDLRQTTSWFTTMHIKIQRYERPWGIFVELPFAAITFYLLFIRFA